MIAIGSGIGVVGHVIRPQLTAVSNARLTFRHGVVGQVIRPHVIADSNARVTFRPGVVVLDLG